MSRRFRQVLITSVWFCLGGCVLPTGGRRQVVTTLSMDAAAHPLDRYTLPVKSVAQKKNSPPKSKQTITANADSQNATVHLVKSGEKTKKNESSPPSPPPATGISTADFNEDKPLPLFAAVRLVLKRNHDIRVASYNSAQAVTDVRSAGSVFNPILFSDTEFGRSRGDWDGRNMLTAKSITNTRNASAGVRQRIPLGGTLSLSEEFQQKRQENVRGNRDATLTSTAELKQPLLRGWGDPETRSSIRIAKLNVAISDEAFREKAIRAVADGVTAYWRLYQAREEYLINRRVYRMAVEVLARETNREREGIGKAIDVSRARVAVETRKADMLRQQRGVRIASDKLELTMGVNEVNAERVTPLTLASHPLTQPQSVALEPAIAIAMKMRPEAISSGKTVAVRREMEKLSRHNRLPKLDAVLRYSLRGDGDRLAVAQRNYQDKNQWVAGLQFEFPLGNDKANSEYARRKLEREQAQRDRDRINAQVLNEVRISFHALQLASEEIPSADRGRREAIKVVKGEGIRLELGQIGNAELLRAQVLLASAERKYLQAVVEYNISLIEFHAAQGDLLRELGIHIESGAK